MIQRADYDENFVEDLKIEDEILRSKAAEVTDWRKSSGLDGLVGGLQAVIINTEPELHQAAAEELLRYTNLDFQGAFQDASRRTYVLKTPSYIEFRSADFLITSSKDPDPFRVVNMAPKSRHLPSTRLDTFIFETIDLEKYVSIQLSQGVKFRSRNIIEGENYLFIQTRPSRLTGNSLGFIEWNGTKGNYRSRGSEELFLYLRKPEHAHFKNIRWLDHAATRVKAQDRNEAILEFMRLTNYYFDFAVYVPSLNSITSVARLSDVDYAMVFTTGIKPYISDDVSGPTEKFIHNYGTRVHHIAFQTEQIEQTYQDLAQDGLRYLIELVGSPDEGLKQTFTEPSKNTLLVTEYIHRYGDFDGFFTKSNVTLLTESTSRQ